jgi:hypothetical protein
VLEKDPEFRYAVVGILGVSQSGDQLSDISRSEEKLLGNREKTERDIRDIRTALQRLTLGEE